MDDESKDPKKGIMTEDDSASLLQRYSVETVLTLLREVEQVAEEKIDWDELVKNTATGISSAREYQTLWRHLAYRKPLEDEIDSDAEPMDDDSDLEFEIEASPSASYEALAEVEACVKVLIASGSDDPLLPSETIDAPLAITIPTSKEFTAPSDSSFLANASLGKKVIIPVSVPKSTGGLTPRTKSSDWYAEEDIKLTAAVQKRGELDWDTITRDFNNSRTTKQLSKRWNYLKKKLGKPDVGSSSQPSEAVSTSTHGAMPGSDTLSAASQTTTSNSSASQPEQQFAATEPPISQVPTEMFPMKRTTIADSVKDAAIAAGARIGTTSEASLLIEASRSQNVVHLKSSAGSVMRTYRASTPNQLPSNVNLIRGGITKAPSSSYSAPIPGIAKSPSSSYSAPAPYVSPAGEAWETRLHQPNTVGASRVLTGSSERTTSIASMPSVTKSLEGASGSSSGSGMKDQADSPVSAPVEQIPRCESFQSEESTDQASDSSFNPGNQPLDVGMPMQCSDAEESGDGGAEATSSNSMAPAGDDKD